MTEIFVLTINEVYDMETFEEKVSVYSTLKEAQAKLNQCKEADVDDYDDRFGKATEENDLDGWILLEDEANTYYEIYKNGCYSDFHVTANISKFVCSNGKFERSYDL